MTTSDFHVSVAFRIRPACCQAETREKSRKRIPPISTNFRHNHQIRISPIRLIDHNDQQLGLVSTSDALKMALEVGMDLVEVAPTAKPPVCRIMDYGKWRYMQQKKDDKSRANNKGGLLKELKLKTVRIGEHDLQIKINHAREFLEENNKVQFTLQFRGRELAHLDLGRQIFIKIKTALADVCKVERDAKMEGKRMTLVLQPEHKVPAKPAKGGGGGGGGGGSNTGGGSGSAPAVAGLKSAAPASGSSLNISLPPKPEPVAAGN